MPLDNLLPNSQDPRQSAGNPGQLSNLQSLQSNPANNDMNGQDMSQLQAQTGSGINFNLLAPIKGDAHITPISHNASSQGGLQGLGDALMGLSKMPIKAITDKMGVTKAAQVNPQQQGNPLQQQQQLGQTALSPQQNQQYSGQLFQNAQKELGMRQSDPALGTFLQKSNPGLNPSKTPWCSAFVNSVLKDSGLEGTGSLAAKSYLKYGQPTQSPNQGDIVVFNDLTGQNRPEHGHVGFVKGIDRQAGTVTVLGGNQGGQVSVKTYPLSAVAGFRTPPTAEQLAGVKDPHPELKQTMDGIIGVESQGNTQAVSKPSRNGDRAYGYSQILGTNIPKWTQEALGHPLTPQQFLQNPEAQRITTSFKVNQLLKAGNSPQDVASMWFSGRPLNKAAGLKDSYGTTTEQYQKKFNQGYLESKMNL